MYEYKAWVYRVIDADTVDVEINIGFKLTTRQRLRLIGINAPETFGETRVSGLLAKDYVLERLLEKEVIIKTYRIDVFGRWLAEVFVDGVNINKELLERGLAEPYGK